mmetsp:Transcript_100132/g.172886  ORF Transcript_100132/g.172886 Transcript_100132/m.172886 type:complete len:102 (+) Transcript_100132:168-473(+)
MLAPPTPPLWPTPLALISMIPFAPPSPAPLAVLATHPAPSLRRTSQHSGAAVQAEQVPTEEGSGVCAAATEQQGPRGSSGQGLSGAKHSWAPHPPVPACGK